MSGVSAGRCPVNVCYYHGANPKNHGGAPSNNRNAMKHGAYIDKLLNEEEEIIFQNYYEALLKEFKPADSSEQELARKAGLCYVRLLRAIHGGSAEDIYKLDGMWSKKVARLKAIKRKRERGHRKITYEEWKADLLAHYNKFVEEGMIKKVTKLEGKG